MPNGAFRDEPLFSSDPQSASVYSHFTFAPSYPRFFCVGRNRLRSEMHLPRAGAAAMDTPQAEVQYFLEEDGQRRGPYPLSGLIDAGMQAESMVWWEGLESAARAGKVPKLAALLKKAQRERQAAKRADRLPPPEPFQWLARVCLVLSLSAAAICVVGSTALWTSAVIHLSIASSSGPPPARPNGGLEIAGIVLFIAGLLGSLLGLGCFVVEAVFLRRLVSQCRALVEAASPSRSSEKESPDPGGLPKELGNHAVALALPHVLGVEDMSTEGLTVLLWYRLFPALFIALFLAIFTLLPLGICLVKPELSGLLISIVVMLVIYSAVHLPTVVFLLMNITRPGPALNHVIVRYRLKVPWAPVGFAFWTAICGMLMLAGPFGLAFFGLLALWVWQTSKTAAMICSPESRQRIAMALPEEKAEKPAAWVSPFGD